MQLKHVKTTRVGGREYRYFLSPRKTPAGKPILIRLPDIDDPAFWPTYAAHMSARSKVAQEIMTVPALVNMYKRSPKFASLAIATQDAYGIYLQRLSENFETAPAGEIARKDVLRVVDKMKPGAANLFVGVVGALYRWGRERGHVENDPARDIVKNEGGEHEPWPQHLVELALASDDAMVRLGTHLLLYTAQRIGDVCRMRWTDISGDEIRVTQQKTGKALDIRLHSALRKELSAYPRSFDTILSLKSGRPVQIQYLRYALQGFATRHGYKVVPHGLRKNAVNALLEAGCTVAQTSAISGQSLQIVEHYARRRNQSALGSAAILQWERGQNVNAQKLRK